MFSPLIFLSVGSLFLGYLASDLFVGFGGTFFSYSIFVHPFHSIALDCEYIPLAYKLLPFVLTVIGGSLSFIVFIFYKPFFADLVKFKIVRSLVTYFNKK